MVMRLLPFVVLEDGTFSEEGLELLGLPIDWITKEATDKAATLSDLEWSHTTDKTSDLYEHDTAMAILHNSLEPFERTEGSPWVGFYGIAMYDTQSCSGDTLRWANIVEVARFNARLVQSLEWLAGMPFTDDEGKVMRIVLRSWRITIRTGLTEEARAELTESSWHMNNQE